MFRKVFFLVVVALLMPFTAEGQSTKKTKETTVHVQGCGAVVRFWAGGGCIDSVKKESLVVDTAACGNVCKPPVKSPPAKPKASSTASAARRAKARADSLAKRSADSLEAKRIADSTAAKNAADATARAKALDDSLQKADSLEKKAFADSVARAVADSINRKRVKDSTALANNIKDVGKGADSSHSKKVVVIKKGRDWRPVAVTGIVVGGLATLYCIFENCFGDNSKKEQEGDTATGGPLLAPNLRIYLRFP